MAITFLDVAIKTLEKAQSPLTAEEIWAKSEELGTRTGFETSGKTPALSLGAQCYVEIKNNGEKTIYKASKQPTRFFLTKLKEKLKDKGISETSLKKKSPQAIPKIGWKERDLHPLLTSFVRANPHFHAWTKTIYHESSKKESKGKNDWLYPDLVGVYFPFDDYSDFVLKIQEKVSESSIRLYSFEMKQRLGFGNLRSSYFQAVSNSSWASEGYLVALEIDSDGDFQDELRRLNSAFGIGIIHLNPNQVDQSEIVFPSRIETAIDWNMVTELL